MPHSIEDNVEHATRLPQVTPEGLAIFLKILQRGPGANLPRRGSAYAADQPTLDPLRRRPLHSRRASMLLDRLPRTFTHFSVQVMKAERRIFCTSAASSALPAGSWPCAVLLEESNFVGIANPDFSSASSHL